MIFKNDPEPERTEIEARLAEIGALKRDDHFVYKSGKHGDTYFNKDDVLVDTCVIAAISWHIVNNIATFNRNEVVIAGPAMAGIALAHRVSDAAMRRRWTNIYRTIYADKVGDDFAFKRGYAEYLSDATVVVIEDVLTTGSSVRSVIQQVRLHGGEVVAVGAMCNRGGLTAEALGVRELYAFLNLHLPQHEASSCPLCAAGKPINTALGHGRVFVSQFGQPAPSCLK